VRKTTSPICYYGDYQYQRNIKDKINWTAGISGSYSESTAQLFGDHTGVNASFYTQFDAKMWKKLSVSFGVRAEYFRIDTAESVSSYALYVSDDTLQLPVWPVFRAGLNYQLAKFTFIRASFGQGYRFPTIAEKFVKASVGGLNIFPNPDLKPETGWSAEVGVKQGVKLGQWNGYLDVAGFWTEYSNMMEFTFGVYKPDSALYPTIDDIGFKSINVGHARINGFDITFTGQGKIFDFPAIVLAGYTYTNPVDLNYDPALDSNNSTESKILKYRYYHSVKGDFEITLNRFTVGLGMIYFSHMINIDKVFQEPILPGVESTTILPGLKEYREKNNRGYTVFDVRIGFVVTETSRLSLLVKNALNKEYMTRPGFIEAPRNVALQYSMSF
jgi:outer membrane receptor protein involved in Fe transport